MEVLKFPSMMQRGGDSPGTKGKLFQVKSNIDLRTNDMSKFSLTIRQSFRGEQPQHFKMGLHPFLGTFGFCDQVTSSSRNQLQGSLPGHVPAPQHAKEIFTPSVSVHMATVSMKPR